MPRPVEHSVTRTVVAVLEEVKELAKSRREQLVPVPMDISSVAQAPDDPLNSMHSKTQNGCDDDDWAGYGSGTTGGTVM